MKDIEGYEGLYAVDAFGNVFSYRRGKWLKNRINGKGYFSVILYKDKKGKEHKVHRLVAKAFVDGYIDGLSVNHKDGNTLNNHHTNLEWTTAKENSLHSCQVLGHNLGEKNGNHRLTKEVVIIIRKLYEI